MCKSSGDRDKASGRAKVCLASKRVLRPKIDSAIVETSESTNDRTYHRAVSDNEGGVTSENQTTGFPASVAVAGSVPGALTPNHRQASPFPMESTNSRRHHYNNSVSSDRSRNVANGEVIYAAPSKKTSSGSGSVAGGGNASTGSVSGGTLGRRSRRGQHNSALSSSSTASDRSEIIYNEEHSHIHLNNVSSEFSDAYQPLARDANPDIAGAHSPYNTSQHNTLPEKTSSTPVARFVSVE
ncbi:Protein of unknown function [Cotesia congregata]|uniref:Uncharacterized protein n=1 Tax=Cotesia congregata TaxID=51543 RepID=A0A8J2H5U4_COTCN|nr:Protein of unknown function [Cotesia congregata]